MENNDKKYWKGLEELNKTPEFENLQKKEFAEELPVEELFNESTLTEATPRRDFLKALGFGVGAVTLAACNEAPVRKAIPYLVKPEEITPGIPNYYATTCNACSNGCGIIVKTREGRPIKVDGNPDSPISKGGTCAVGQASVLDLYDSGKLTGPKINGNDSSWDAVDNFVKGELNVIASKNRNIRILSSSITSPSTKKVIADFITKYPSAKHITYDAVSYSAIINANKNSFDKAVLPSYRFDKADLIVSFGADFLGTWISPVEFTKQYTGNKKLKDKKLLRHIQFESGLSLTGSNADKRVPIRPSQEGMTLLGLYNNLTGMAGGSKLNAETPEYKGNAVAETARELWAAKGKALVVSGSNDVSVQVLVNAINSLLGSYGNTIDLDNPSYQRQGNDADMLELVKEMNNGAVDALILYGVNPSYDYPRAEEFNAGLKKVKLSVSFADRADETASKVNVIAPDHHYLESWNDSEAKKGIYSIIQPTISPVYNTRAAQQSLLNWSDNTITYYDFIRNYWNQNLFSKQSKALTFSDFWQSVVHDGVFSTVEEASASSYSFNKDLNTVAETIVNASKNGSKTELSIYEPVALRDGKHANNPWLQELPDPVAKVTWDNFVAISKKQADELGLKENYMAVVKAGNYSVKLPVVIQPGQAYGTVSIAAGYGRTGAGKAGNNVGANVYPFVSLVNGSFQYMNPSVEITFTGERYELASTQTHHSIEGRPVVRETTLAEYAANPYAGSGNENKPHMYDLWDKREKNGHHWGMSIDLNSCTGCGACVVSCNAENNVAVVGRDEVRRRREMHWIRIDRYYTFNSGEEQLTKEKDINKLQDFDDVSVIYQPMLCQHCDHAPCETVCPVLATMHSSDGLSQQAYNRCVGTRYCANNCPYKVRRFNWFNYADNDEFDYHMNNGLGKMVLNPDVTVRSRGVMEKCSFCVQRIQSGKLEAKMQNSKLTDGMVKTACQQACPGDAIIFGDINDSESQVSKLLRNERTFYVLEELNTQPGIGYMTKVRNVEPSKA